MKKMICVLFLFGLRLQAQPNFFVTEDSGFGANDRGWDLVADSTGYTVATAFGLSSTDIQMGLLRFDLNGQLLWKKNYQDFRQGAENCLIRTKDGNYIVAGDRLIDGDYYIFLMKLTPEGDSLWTKYFNETSNFARSVIELENGDLIVKGDGRPIPGPAIPDNTIIKTDKDGNLIWHKNIFDNYRLSQHGNLIELNTGELLMVSQSHPDSSNIPRAALFKLDTAGYKIWIKDMYPIRTNSEVLTRELMNGNYMVVAGIDSFISGLPSLKLIATVLDTSGQILYQNIFYTNKNLSVIRGIEIDPWGNALIAAYSLVDFSPTEPDKFPLHLINLSPTCTVNWERFIHYRANLPQNFTFYPETVKISPYQKIAISITKDNEDGPDKGDPGLLVLDINGCWQEGINCDSSYQYLVTPVGEPQVLRPTVNVYPNPATELVTIDNKSEHTLNVSVTDAFGRTYLSKHPLAAAETISQPLANWPAGIYFVYIYDAGHWITTQSFIRL
jgi:hypothetical protein